MSMALDKCAQVTRRRGKLISTENTALDIDTEIWELNYSRPTNLEIDEIGKIQYTEMKETINREY